MRYNFSDLPGAERERVMLPRLSKPIRTVLLWQVLVTAAISIAAALVAGEHGAISALAGGMVSFIAGLVSAVVTPMRSDGEVDDDALRRYIRWLLSFDRLKALAVNMDTGVGPALSRLERRRVLEIYVDQTSGRIPVLAGIGAPSTAGAVQIALDARDAGASGLVVFPHPVFVGEPLPPEVPYE